MQEGHLPGADEVLQMARREIDQLYVIRNYLEGRMKRSQAARTLGRSVRQISRLAKRIQEQGARGVVHGLRGRPSNHQIDPFDLERALCALHDPLWHDFGPTFAQQQLRRRCRIKLGVETLRQLMIASDRWKPGTRKARHRKRRERRRRLGMMVQLDGSHHDWFEGRGPGCVLIEFIDDATSRILHAEFVDSEDRANLMRAAKTYMLRFGRPLALYVDRHSVYRVNRQATVEEDLQDQAPLTQFSRAMKQLGVEVIKAWSPQAKGRVERSFRTHQDRLIKELRLRGITSREEANAFLWNNYLPSHNRAYVVDPADPRDAHRPLLKSHDLDAILAVHSPRMVQSDFIVQYQRRFFQIQPEQPVRVRPKDRVLVVEGLDRSIRIAFKGRFLDARELPQRPYRPFHHPKIRSRQALQPPPFYGDPARHSPLPNQLDSARFDALRLLRGQVRKQALMQNS